MQKYAARSMATTASGIPTRPRLHPTAPARGEAAPEPGSPASTRLWRKPRDYAETPGAQRRVAVLSAQNALLLLSSCTYGDGGGEHVADVAEVLAAGGLDVARQSLVAGIECGAPSVLQAACGLLGNLVGCCLEAVAAFVGRGDMPLAGRVVEELFKVGVWGSGRSLGRGWEHS